MWQSVTVTAAVCVTWSVGERVTGCESAQGMGPVGRGRAGGPGQGGWAQTGVPSPWAVKTSVFWVFSFLLKKARNINRNS